MAKVPKGHDQVFSVVVAGKTYDIQLKTSQRRSYSLKVLSSESAELRAPLKTTVTQAKAVVLQHGDWLVQKSVLMKHKDRLEVFDQSEYTVYYGGRPQRLSIVKDLEATESTLTYQELTSHFVMRSAKPSLEETEWFLSSFYKKRAEQMIRLSLESYQDRLPEQPSQVQIKDQKARWGSCNQKGQIRLNFRIAQCSQALCDYLVLHELCHLRHMNHSEAFWSYMASLMPDYKQRRAALKGFSADRLLMNRQKDL